jgi:TatD DNase family protein
MPEKTLKRIVEEDRERVTVESQKVEYADAHCHLDMIEDREIIDRAISHGVLTMVSNGVNAATNKRTLELCDKRRIFAALGIDPENAVKIPDDDLDSEIEAGIAMIKKNMDKVVSVGEIGLDYTKARTFELVAKQKTVFERFLEAAKELKLPVSVHSRNSMDEVLRILEEHKMERVHLHFFEGNVAQAKEAERKGYMISIPPIESNKRRLIIKDVGIDHLMAESDAPAVGATPIDVETSVRIVAETKSITIPRAAEALTLNTKRFFNLQTKIGFMRG